MSAERQARPWYREPWPWIVMSGPALVVVAGTITAVIAVRTSDGLVADDYYKQGLMVNRVTERETRARALGIAAQVMFNEERDRVRVILASNAPLPGELRLTLIHPTRRDDQSVELRGAGPGIYEGRLKAPSNAAWRVALEDTAATWRVTGRWQSAPSPPGTSKDDGVGAEGRGEGNVLTLGRVD